MKGRIGPGLAVVIGALGVFAVVAILFGFTVVTVAEEEAATVEFDPAAFVDGVWDNVQTTINDQAVDLTAILREIEPDTDGKVPKEALVPVAEQYGLVTPGDAHVYMVTTTGTVTDVDTETSRGTLGLQVDGYDGPIDVRAYVGPRIPSDETSVRDATGIIRFGDFREQTEYGKVASEINRRVLTQLSELDTGSLVGQEIILTGAMMMRTQNLTQIPVGQLTIVPLEIATQ